MKILLSSAVLSLVMVAAPVAQAQFVRIAPPAPIVEVIPPSPSPQHVWVPGYHRWDGHQHVWMPGAYELPRGHYTHWQPHRWEHEGRGYRFHRGEWR